MMIYYMHADQSVTLIYNNFHFDIAGNKHYHTLIKKREMNSIKHTITWKNGFRNGNTHFMSHKTHYTEHNQSCKNTRATANQSTHYCISENQDIQSEEKWEAFISG